MLIVLIVCCRWQVPCDKSIVELKVLDGVEVSKLPHQIGKTFFFYGSGFMHRSIVMLKQEIVPLKLLPQSLRHTIVLDAVC